jgi:hypothetical protein
MPRPEVLDLRELVDPPGDGRRPGGQEPHRATAGAHQRKAAAAQARRVPLASGTQWSPHGRGDRQPPGHTPLGGHPVRRAAVESLPLDQPVSEGESTTLGQLVADRHAGTDQFDAAEQVALLLTLLQRLDDRELTVVILRSGVLASADKRWRRPLGGSGSAVSASSRPPLSASRRRQPRRPLRGA